MELKKVSSKDLINELEKRKEIKAYTCGLYEEYEVQIKRKYTQDRELEELPDNYKLLLIID